jgi:DNA repair exonuclease SbcCD ATPase subunit
LDIYNRPSGAKYYSNFAPDKGETIIELKPVETKPIVLTKEVHRKKDGTKVLDNTIYEYDGNKFGDDDGGVGRYVPDIISQALNISELNIQRQFDQPFLILSSAGEFARVINRVTRLEKVDDWVSEFKKRINKTKNDVELLEEQTKQAETELAKYAGFEDLEGQVDLLQKTSNELEKAEIKFNGLDRLLGQVEKIDDQLDKLKPALAIEEDILVLAGLENSVSSGETFVLLVTKARAIQSNIQGFQTILEGLKGLESIFILEERFSNLDGRLAKIEQIDNIIDDLKILGQSLTQLETLIEQEDQCKKLGSYLTKIEQINISIDSSTALYNKSNTELLEMLKDVKECPVFKLPCPSTEKMINMVKESL